MHAKPPAPNTATDKRWKENQRRRRMLEGDWLEDLEHRIVAMVGPTRRAVWGEPDMAHNVARSIINQLSTLYNAPAHPMHETGTAVDAIKPWLDSAGHWQILQGFMPLIVGQREGLVRVDVVPDPVRGGVVNLQTRSVPADLVAVDAHPDLPDVPTWVAEYRIRLDASGNKRWTRDVFDLRNPDAPAFRIETADGKEVISAIAGDEYMARWSDSAGVPFIPGEWYHAQRTGKLADPATGMELFDGALTLAALWTLWGNIITNASWPQRYIIGGGVRGTEAREGDGMPFVDTDPTSVLLIEGEPGVSPTAGQWQPGGDPVAIAESLAGYAGKLAADLDITPSDIARATGDSRSGYAIELTSEGKRHAQRRYAMSFERHDAALLGKIAAMLTRAGAASIPDTGWSVEYQGIPLTLSERIAQLDELQRLVELGLISRAEALARHEGIPLETARKRLDAAQADIARYRA